MNEVKSAILILIKHTGLSIHFTFQTKPNHWQIAQKVPKNSQIWFVGSLHPSSTVEKAI
jgi:hypothetical protein